MQKSESDYNMIDWWKKVVFRNYANFTGRARRSEYWYFVLGQVCLIIPFYVLMLSGMVQENDDLFTIALSVYALFFLATLLPALAVTVRRLHDLDKSGAYYFLIFVPFGSIILLVWMCTIGKPFRNKYGEDPKNPEEPLFDFERPADYAD